MGKIFTTTVLIPILFLSGCFSEKKETSVNKSIELSKRDLNAIKEEGVVRVVTNYNSTNYFVYKGTPMGYQLELLQEFSNYLGLKLDITVNNDLSTNYLYLKQGKTDIVASNLAATLEKNRGILFTEPHSFSRQVLIQQRYKPDNGR